MSDIESVIRETLIQSVSTRTVGANQTTIWDIQTQGGPKISTFQAGVGNKASALAGQVCDLKVRVEQKGDFTNYMLLSIQPSGGNAVMTAVANAAAAAPTQDITFDQFKSGQDEKETAKTESIHRQTASKVAAALLPSDPGEFWANVTDLVHFFKTGERPGSSVTSHTANDPVFDPNADSDVPF